MNCRICKSTNLIKFLDLGKQPFANSLLKAPLLREKKYPLELAFCKDCKLVQLTYTADPKKLFSNYFWVTGTSQVTRDYAEKFCKRVLGKDDHTVIEVGSNDGTFLKPFMEHQLEVLGIDPAENIKTDIPTTHAFFNSKFAKKYLGEADIVIARNVLPHVKNTNDFVKGLAILMSEKGKLALEIHYAGKILKDLHYDSIYHEHLCYFSLKSLEKLLNKHNLYVYDIDKSPINAGNILVLAKKGKVKEKAIVQKYRDMEVKSGLNTFVSWKKFANRSIQHSKKLRCLLNLLNDFSGKIVGYGASARSSTLINFSKIDLPIIADLNPLKQRHYTAGRHILIESPDLVLKTNPDYIVILAWNFKDEIIDYVRKEFGYKGRFIIPLPEIKVL